MAAKTYQGIYRQLVGCKLRIATGFYFKEVRFVDTFRFRYPIRYRVQAITPTIQTFLKTVEPSSVRPFKKSSTTMS